MKKLLYFGTVLLAAVSVTLPLLAAPAFAAEENTNQAADGPYIEHTDENSDKALKGTRCPNAQNCELVKNYVQPAVDFLAAFVGVAVVISMIYGGIEYASSAGDPQKSSAGKKRIRNSIFALLLFFFFYAFLRFALLPGDTI